METEKNTAAETDVKGAAASGGGEPAAAAAGAGQETKQEPAAKTYDQAYIDKLLADQKAATDAAVAEALKVAKMDEDSKASYEQEKAAKELADREAKIAARERKADALDILAKNDVPSEFVDILVGDTTEKTKANVAAFKGRFDAAVQAQVEKRLAGTTPKGGSGSGTLSEEEAMAAEIKKYL